MLILLYTTTYLFDHTKIHTATKVKSDDSVKVATWTFILSKFIIPSPPSLHTVLELISSILLCPFS